MSHYWQDKYLSVRVLWLLVEYKCAHSAVVDSTNVIVIVRKLHVNREKGRRETELRAGPADLWTLPQGWTSESRYEVCWYLHRLQEAWRSLVKLCLSLSMFVATVMRNNNQINSINCTE